MYHCILNFIHILTVFFSLQNISGIRLTDVFLKRTYDYDDLAQVFVIQPAT